MNRTWETILWVSSLPFFTLFSSHDLDSTHITSPRSGTPVKSLSLSICMIMNFHWGWDLIYWEHLCSCCLGCLMIVIDNQLRSCLGCLMIVYALSEWTICISLVALGILIISYAHVFTVLYDKLCLVWTICFASLFGRLHMQIEICLCS